MGDMKLGNSANDDKDQIPDVLKVQAFTEQERQLVESMHRLLIQREQMDVVLAGTRRSLEEVRSRLTMLGRITPSDRSHGDVILDARLGE